jgi:hypothetical protein
MVGLASIRMPCNLVCGLVYREMLVADITAASMIQWTGANSQRE